MARALISARRSSKVAGPELSAKTCPLHCYRGHSRGGKCRLESRQTRGAETSAERRVAQHSADYSRASDDGERTRAAVKRF